MQQQERLGIGPCSRHMEVMDVNFSEWDLELRKRIELGFLCPPVEGCAPVLDEAAHVAQISTVLPPRVGRLIGQPSSSQPRSQVFDVSIGHV